VAVDLCKLSIRRPGFSFMLADFQDIEGCVFELLFPNGCDAVLCIDVLYHIMEDSLFDVTLRNIFQSGARVIVLYTYPKGTQERIMRDNCMHIRDPFPSISKYQGDYFLIEESQARGDTGARFFVYERSEPGTEGSDSK